MAATKPKTKVARSVPPQKLRYYVGIDAGNTNTEALLIKDEQNGSLNVASATVYSMTSWVYEYAGLISNLRAVSDYSGSTINYKAGHSAYEGRVFAVGGAAHGTQANVASLMGDDDDNKAKYYLPVFLHVLAANVKEADDFEVIVVASVDDMTLAPAIKESLLGLHRFDVMDTSPSGEMVCRSMTVNVHSGVTREGYGTAWDQKDQSDIDFFAPNIIADGGGREFSAMVVKGRKLMSNGVEVDSAATLAEASVPVGGNLLTTRLVELPSLRQKFREKNIPLDRDMINSRIMDGTFTFTPGDGTEPLNFSDEALSIIQELIPVWVDLVSRVTKGQGGSIKSLIMTGGVFLTAYKGDPDNEDEGLRSPWSIAQIFQREFIYKPVHRTDSNILNARGNLKFALGLDKSLPKPLPLSTR